MACFVRPLLLTRVCSNCRAFEEKRKRKEEEDRIREQLRKELFTKAKAHLEEGAFIESLSYLNELLVLFPNDKDALELRRTIVTGVHDEVSGHCCC